MGVKLLTKQTAFTSPWLNFSGAPAMLIPASLTRLWRGAIDPTTNSYSDLNVKEPRTDYDRACAAAWPGRGELSLGQSSALVFYSEYDEHAWMANESVGARDVSKFESEYLKWRDRRLTLRARSEVALFNRIVRWHQGMQKAADLSTHSIGQTT